MKLEELAKMDRLTRLLSLSKLPHDQKYQQDINKGLRFFTADELDDIENNNKELTYKQINEILSAKGMIVKLPTFKKYINLNLISSSFGRVNKSSIGLYSPSIIREINFIKYAIFSNLDLKTFSNSFDTNACEMFFNYWGADPIYVVDYAIESDSNGNTYPEIIKKMISMFYEKQLITIKKRNEINKILEKIVNSAKERVANGEKLQESLEKIKIENQKALSLLEKLNISTKVNNKIINKA